MPWKTRAYRWIEKIEHLARGARQPPGTPWTPNLPAQEPAGQKAGQPLNAQGFRGGAGALTIMYFEFSDHLTTTTL